MRTFFVFLLFLSVSVSAATHGQVDDFPVETRIGTDLHGHTFPGASAPFGMVQLSPDTRVEGWDACAGYHYSDSTILGFSHTHLSGTGIPDYGDILLTPVRRVDGQRLGKVADYRQGFSHDDEETAAGYYRVRLRSGIEVELTATPRVGVHRYSFPLDAEPAFILNLAHGLGPDRVTDSRISVTGEREVSGSRRSSGWAKDQQIFFHMELSEPIERFAIFRDLDLLPDSIEASGTDIRAVLRFPGGTSRSLSVKVGLSFVSAEGARTNLRAEAGGRGFDEIRQETADRWTREFGKIQIEGGTPEQRTAFYTALYRTMLAPNIASDVDGSYRGMDGSLYRADQFIPYTVFSLWDTFRAEHPLLSIIDRERTSDFVQTLLAKYDQSSTLPVWELASNETNTMIGYHAVPVILDAYVKGIGGFSPHYALEAMKASAMKDHHGLPAYREHGYIPADQDGESVSKTMEYAYDDWCIARMADLLGADRDASYYYARSRSYRNLFDPETRLMRPKANSTWVEPFDPSSVTFHYTEANAWQYSFFAPHDPGGLIRLMGGAEGFSARLDSLFLARPELKGRIQPDISGMIGQYAHGNEPSHHVAYLYNYAGQPWKTERIVRKILDSLYTSRPDGLCGNEDCGQMSAWYVMSALGFYQVCPGDPTYALVSPLFPRAVIRLENGRTFVIESDQAAGKGRFVSGIALNGRLLSTPFLSHDSLAAGGTLRFIASDAGNWEPAATVPVPLQGPPPLPAFRAPSSLFSDSLIVGLSSADPGAALYYTVVEGEEPERRYMAPLRLTASTRVRAKAVLPDGSASETVTGVFTRYKPVGTIRLLSPYSHQYTGGGDGALLDSRRGAADWRLGAWQGYEGIPFEGVIDLGSVRTISRVALGTLQDQNSWIFFPTSVAFSLSADGEAFLDERLHVNQIPEDHDGSLLQEFNADFGGAEARFIRVRAESIGTCPSWHKGAGGKAWLFLDEIIVDTVE